MIRASEVIAREVIQGQTDEVLGLINPVNDDNLAAWMMAKDRAQRLVGTIQTVCDAISARTPALRPIAEGMRIPGEAAWKALSPEEKAEIEAEFSAEVAEIERINQTHVDPFFAPALAMVQPPRSAAS